MKVVLPLAGKGTRLLPLTKHVPKPLIRVAGRPVLDYVMDRLEGVDIDELIIITGHLKEQVEEYVTTAYDIPARFVEQEVQDGTAGAVNLARPYVDGSLLIIFVDTVFDADVSVVRETEADGIIWTKEVEDYQRFGVVVTNEAGYMTRIVEKPSEPISRLANIGLYYIRDWETLFDGIEATLRRPRHKGEWFLTDAFQYMVDKGKNLRTAEVRGWYDCGKLNTLLETNHHLLAAGRAQGPDEKSGVTIVEPVRIGEGVELEDCTIGPNVTVDAQAVVRSSTVEHAIVGAHAVVADSTISHCLIGDRTTITGQELSGMIAADREVAAAP